MTWRCLCEASQHVVGRPGIGVKCRGLDLGVIDTVVLVLSLLRVCWLESGKLFDSCVTVCHLLGLPCLLFHSFSSHALASQLIYHELHNEHRTESLPGLKIKGRPSALSLDRSLNRLLGKLPPSRPAFSGVFHVIFFCCFLSVEPIPAPSQIALPGNSGWLWALVFRSWTHVGWSLSIFSRALTVTSAQGAPVQVGHCLGHRPLVF